MDFRRFSGLGAGCLPALTLQRLGLGELGGEAAAAARRHLDECKVCRERQRSHECDFALLPDVDEEALVERIENSIFRAEAQREIRSASHDMAEGFVPLDHAASPEGGTGARAAPSRARYWLPGLLAAAAIPLLIWLSVPVDGSLSSLEGRSDAVQVKGHLPILTVFRQFDGSVVKVPEGTQFRAGDHLRFGASLSKPAQVMVVGYETNGRPYVCFPADGSEFSRLVRTADAEALPGAVALDESIGEEWIFLVACPEPFHLADLSLAAEPGVLGTPAGCWTSSYRMNKVAR